MIWSKVYQEYLGWAMYASLDYVKFMGDFDLSHDEFDSLLFTKFMEEKR